MNNIFGKRLRMLRRERDIVMTDFASSVGLTQATVSKYENGKRIPNIEIINRIAEYFNVSTDYLIGKSDTRAPYHKEAEDFVKDLKKLAKQEGFDIDSMTNQELAEMLMKAIKTEQIYKSK